MRIGILGGTFDPVHYGHLLLAETCRESLELDQVRLIPAGRPPHKQDQILTDGHARADMLDFAVAGCPEFCVDRRELRRAGASFTVDTLGELQDEFPDAELYFLMGADSLRDVPGWRDPGGIARLAWLVACNRPGFPLPTEAQVRDWVGPELAERTRVVTIPGTDLSSTWIRDRVQRGRSLRFLMPRAVAAYIAEHRLYAASDSDVSAADAGSPTAGRRPAED